MHPTYLENMHPRQPGTREQWNYKAEGSSILLPLIFTGFLPGGFIPAWIFQFSNPRTHVLQISKLTRKERKMGKERKREPHEENTGPYPPLASRIDCSAVGGIGKVAAALAKEIVTADVSLGGNLGARGSGRGGGRENEERALWENGGCEV